MSVAIELGRQTEYERKKHEADGPFLFRRKDENLAASLCRQGRCAAASANRYEPFSTDADSATRCLDQEEKVRLHSGRRRT